MLITCFKSKSEWLLCKFCHSYQDNGTVLYNFRAMLDQYLYLIGGITFLCSIQSINIYLFDILGKMVD
jgi:hypothetical protein